MKKADLNTATEAAKTEFRDILQTIYDAHNQGQKKQLLKREKVKEIFDRFGVTYEEG